MSRRLAASTGGIGTGRRVCRSTNTCCRSNTACHTVGNATGKSDARRTTKSPSAAASSLPFENSAIWYLPRGRQIAGQIGSHAMSDGPRVCGITAEAHAAYGDLTL